LGACSVASLSAFQQRHASLSAFSLGFPRPQTFLDKAEVTERVMQVLKNFDKVEDAKVSPTSNFSKDLDLDSLDTVEVCMALEEEFCIQIPDAEAESIKTVEEAVQFVATHPQAK